MSISTALFSEGQSRVYRWVFGEPGREFHRNELLRLTGLGSATLQRELNALADAGLVLSERVGNLRGASQRNLAEHEGFLEVEESAIAELSALVGHLISDVDRLIKG